MNKNHKTVNLRMNQENGQWLYSLPAPVNSKHVKFGKGLTVELRQRFTRTDDDKIVIDPKVKAEQDAYNYHYGLLPDEFTGLDKQEVIDAGYPDKAIMDVQKGELII